MRNIVVVVLCCLVLIGCSQVRLQTNGYTQNQLGFRPGDTFSVIENDGSSNALFDKEIKNKIEIILTKQGYVITQDKPKYLVHYSYSIDGGKNFNRTIPQYHSGEMAQIHNQYGMTVGSVQSPGYTSYVNISNTLYTRTFRIDVLGTEGSTPVWTGETRSIGASDDLRDVIDYLVVANFEQFGVNTRKSVKRKVWTIQNYTKILQPEVEKTDQIKIK